jgi:CelD/BcsL family acetyltransferase involved in cellulose biosynthesis
VSVEWRCDVGPRDWDQALARLNGHPFQSALWGGAQQLAFGVRQQRWMALEAGEPVYLLRFEDRRAPAVGTVAWAPRGPAGAPGAIDRVTPAIAAQLKAAGYVALVTDPWQRAAASPDRVSRRLPRTFWLDLGMGRERLWQGLHPKVRYGVRRAARRGVTIQSSRADADVDRFFALYHRIAAAKRFRTVGSPALLKHLIAPPDGAPVEARLFIARQAEAVAAGGLIIRCGRSVHSHWLGTDRAFASDCPGEALQWGVIEWGLAQDCLLYEQEGVDPSRNPSGYVFKRKLGGQEVVLAGRHYVPFDARGGLISWLDAHVRRW